MIVINQIITEQRPMQQKAKYRLARMHAKLLPEFDMINERWNAMVAAYDTREPEGDRFIVPDDKMPEFLAAWKEIADEEIEVDIQAIPIGLFDLGHNQDGSIHASELITLGDLVTDL